MGGRDEHREFCGSLVVIISRTVARSFAAKAEAGWACHGHSLADRLAERRVAGIGV